MKASAITPTQNTSSCASSDQQTSNLTPAFENNRPEAVQLKEIKDMTHNSPRTVAQRQAFVGAFGDDNPPSPKPNSTGIPDTLKTGLESYSGMDLSDVKVHYNSFKPEQLQALAYAQGNEIHLSPGQEKHLPHEGWHVVQQRQGRVKPTMQMKGGKYINDNNGLENEADVMGAKAMNIKSGHAKHSKLHDLYPNNSQKHTIQLVKGLQRGNIVSVVIPGGAARQGMILKVNENTYEVSFGKQGGVDAKDIIDQKYVSLASGSLTGAAASPDTKQSGKSPLANTAASSNPAAAMPSNASANEKEQSQSSPSVLFSTPASFASAAAAAEPSLPATVAGNDAQEKTNALAQHKTPDRPNLSNAVLSPHANAAQASVLHSILSKSVLNVVGEFHNNIWKDLEMKFLHDKIGLDAYWLENEFTVQGGADGKEIIFGDSLRMNFPQRKLEEGMIRLRSMSPLNHDALDYGGILFTLLPWANLMKADFKLLDPHKKQQLKDIEPTLIKLISLLESYASVSEFPSAAEILEISKQVVKKIEELEKMNDHTTISLDDQRSKAMHDAAQKGKDKRGVWKIGQAHVNDIKRMRLVGGYNLVDSEKFLSEFHAWMKSSANANATSSNTSVAHAAREIINAGSVSDQKTILEAIGKGYSLEKTVEALQLQSAQIFDPMATAAAGTARPIGSSGPVAATLPTGSAAPPSALVSNAMQRPLAGDIKIDGLHDSKSAAGAGALTATSSDLKTAVGTALDTKEGASGNKAVTSYGIFKAVVYQARDGKSGSDEIGCDINLSFTPFSYPNLIGKKIGLIQTVTPERDNVFDPTGGEDDLDQKVKDRSQNLEYLLFRDGKDKGTVNTVIDRDDSLKEVLNPVYGTNGKSEKLSDDKFDDSDNSFGRLERIEPHKATPAKLVDGPTRYRKTYRQSMIFETAAVLLDPPHTYLGSVNWGWEKDADSKKGADGKTIKSKVELIPFKAVGLGEPSKAFISAAEVWNRTKNKNKKDLIKIPIPTDAKSHSDNKDATRKVIKEPNECCYITTACVACMGLSDDCEELTLLRQFRDEYLLSKPHGKALIELYYKYSPQIVSSIRMNENYEEILRRLYSIIKRCVLAIKRGDNEFAFETYCEMVIRLKEIFIPEQHDEIEIEVKKMF